MAHRYQPGARTGSAGNKIERQSIFNGINDIDHHTFALQIHEGKDVRRKLHAIEENAITRFPIENGCENIQTIGGIFHESYAIGRGVDESRGAGPVYHLQKKIAAIRLAEHSFGKLFENRTGDVPGEGSHRGMIKITDSRFNVGEKASIWFRIESLHMFNR